MDQELTSKQILPSTIIILVFLFPIVLQAQVLQYENIWGNGIGGMSQDTPSDITFDPLGNTIVVGSIRDSVDLDLGPSVNMHYAGLSGDIVVGKFRPDGAPAWLYAFGDTGFVDNGHCVITDDTGNIYIGGQIRGTIDFDPDPNNTLLVTAAGFTGYVLKLDSSGTFKWIHLLEGSGFAEVVGLDRSSSGEIVATGQFYGTIDFDPGPGSHQITASTGSQLFAVKFNDQGSLHWAKTFETLIYGYSEVVLSDSSNVYLGGSFGDSIDVDPGINADWRYCNGDAGAYVIKLDSAGDLAWAHTYGGQYNAFVANLLVDENDDLYVYGGGRDSFDIAPGPSTFMIGYGGHNYDMHMMKLSSEGNLSWGYHLGLSGDERARGMSWGPLNNLYIFGKVTSGIDMDPGPGIFMLYSPYTLMAVYDTSGSFIAAQSLDSGAAYRHPAEIDVNPAGEVVTALHFSTSGGLYFTPHPGGATPIYSNGGYDIAIAKYQTCSKFTTVEVVACNSYSPPNSNQTWTQSGNYFDTIGISLGCDSFVVYNLEIIPPLAQIDTVSVIACNSFITPEGDTLNQAGLYQLVYTNALGCDSACYDVYISSSTLDSLEVEACENYSLPSGSGVVHLSGIYLDTLTNVFGCDSVLKLDVTIHNSVQTNLSVQACDEYVSPSGLIYTSSGVIIDSLITIHGCDSVVSTTFTIETLDSSVTNSNDTLFATENSAQYQWATCDEDGIDNLIPGANDQYYLPSSSGSYAVVLQGEYCIDTSQCQDVIIIGSENIHLHQKIALMPNPNNGVFKLNFGELISNATVRFFNPAGMLVYSTQIQNESFKSFDLNLSTGVYFISVEIKNEYIIQQFVLHRTEY